MRSVYRLAPCLCLLLCTTVRAADVFEVVQFRESRHDNAPALDVRFSEAIEADLNVNNLVFLAADGDPVRGEWLVSDDRKKLTFPFVQPQTTYALQILQSLTSVSGRTITPNPALSVGKNALDKLTVRTRKLEAVASFASSGFVLSSHSKKGLPISVVNVSAVDVNFFRVNLQCISAFFQSNINSGKVNDYWLKRLAGYAELIHTSRFEINPTANQRTLTNINISHIARLQQQGLYVAVMKQAGDYTSQSSVIFFSVSDIGLHLRRYEDHFSVFVNDIADGKAIGGVQLALYNPAGERLTETETNGEGESELPFSENAGYVLASKGRDITVLRVDRKALDLSEFKNPLSLHTNIQVFSFGPRDLYRPGETAHVQVLLRDYDGQLIENLPLNIDLFRPDGQKAIATVLHPTHPGYYQLDYQIPATAPTGQFHLRYTVGGQLLTQDYRFNVEEFHPQRLRLEVLAQHPARPLLPHAPQIALPVTGTYLFGAKAAGNKVDAKARLTIDRHPFDEWKPYYFGDEGESINLPVAELKPVVLDKSGQGVLHLEDRWRTLASPLRASLVASLYESGGRPVTEKRSFTVLNPGTYAGIKPQFTDNPDANATVSFELATVNQNAAAIPNQPLDVTLQREDRSYYWSWSNHRGWYWEHDKAPYTAWSGEVSTNTDGRATLTLPLESGHYSLVVSSANGPPTTFSFATAGRWWANVNQDANRPDAVFLGWDKTSHIAGELARLSYASPHIGKAILTIESSNGILFRQHLDLEMNEGTLDVPVGATWQRHDLYASLMVIKPAQSRDVVSPKRAFGLVHLPLSRPNFDINLQVDVTEKAQPGDRVTAWVQADPERLNSPTYVTAALVDVGILNLTRLRTPRPQDWFLDPRRYQTDVFDVYGDIIENAGQRNIRQRFGGGFGDEDGELTPGSSRDPRNLELVAFLNAPVRLDSTGSAEIAFDLPDFDGQLRWMLVAFNNNQFGSANASTVVASPVVLQMAHARYLATGDASQVALDINNLSGTLQNLTVNLTSGGGLAPIDETFEITLGNGEKRVIITSLQGLSAENGWLLANLSNQDQAIQVTQRQVVPVRSPYPAISRVARGHIQANETWHPALVTDDLVLSSVRAQLTLSANPALDLAGHFTYLLQYPYGCLEQVTSRAWPWVHVNRNIIDAFALANQVEQRFGQEFSMGLRREQIELALRNVLALQKANGAFSTWNASVPENLWLTAYATDYLVTLRKQSIPVPDRALQRATGRLLNLVRRPGFQQSEWITDQTRYNFAVQSYAAFVLASSSAISLSDVRRVFDNAPEAAASKLPWMHLGLALKLLGDTKRSELAFTRVGSTHRNDTVYLADYGSALRDIAWVLRYADTFGVTVDIDLHDLAAEIRARNWLSTQERTHLVNLAAVMAARGDHINAALDLDGKTLTLSRDQAYNATLSPTEVASLTSVTARESALYTQLKVTGYPVSAPSASEQEMRVRKQYFHMDGSLADLNQLHTGDLLVVRIEALSEHASPDALIVDTLPAGLELENQNLDDSSFTLEDVVFADDNSSMSRSHAIQHEQYREDRYVAALRLRAGQPIRVFYLARAVTPGTYTVPPAYLEDMYRPYRFGIGKTRQTHIDVMAGQ